MPTQRLRRTTDPSIGLSAFQSVSQDNTILDGAKRFFALPNSRIASLEFCPLQRLLASRYPSERFHARVSIVTSDRHKRFRLQGFLDPLDVFRPRKPTQPFCMPRALMRFPLQRLKAAKKSNRPLERLFLPCHFHSHQRRPIKAAYVKTDDFEGLILFRSLPS